jgi:hypothetical protein
MRLFRYIVIFVDDIRYDERTIWHHAHWGSGGPQHKEHARWERGGLARTHHCYDPNGGRGGPSLTGPLCHSPARGRGGPNPPPPIVVPP